MVRLTVSVYPRPPYGQCFVNFFLTLYQRACALRALGLLLADGALTVGRGKTF